jgi:hypothetical protein
MIERIAGTVIGGLVTWYVIERFKDYRSGAGNSDAALAGVDQIEAGSETTI